MGAPAPPTRCRLQRFFVDQRFGGLELGLLLKDHDDLV